MGAGAAAAHRFGRFILRLDRGVLLADGAECALRPKSFAMLRHFVENPGRLIDRGEIMETVWPGVFVTDDSIGQCVSDIRRALGDSDQSLLRTIRRGGYLFTPPLSLGTERNGSGETASAGPLPPTTLPQLPDKPSIAVLPFQNMSGDPEQEYFADGMVEEITTAMARLPWLFVIARNSSFAYKGRAVDVRQVGRDLGVRYVLEGSVRRAGNRVRISGQLIDAATSAHIWGDRFDGALDDIFELQDQIASSVSGALEPKLRLTEIDRAVRKPPASLDAYDIYLRALAQNYQFTEEGFDEAIALLLKALAIDPAYAAATGLLALVRVWQSTYGLPLAADDIRQTLRLAHRAIELGGDDPEALSSGAGALLSFSAERATARRAIERALAINPNSARTWVFNAALHCFENDPDATMEAVNCAIRLSPRDPLHFMFDWIMGYALMLAGRYEEAIGWTDRSLHDRPTFHPAIRVRLALCGYLDRTDEARAWTARMLAVNPAHTIAWYTEHAGRFLSTGTLAVLVEGMRLAGLPEV
jgi:TolB-like protein